MMGAEGSDWVASGVSAGDSAVHRELESFSSVFPSAVLNPQGAAGSRAPSKLSQFLSEFPDLVY